MTEEKTETLGKIEGAKLAQKIGVDILKETRKEEEQLKKINETAKELMQTTKPKFDKRQFVSLVFKASKIIVLVAFFYTALIMYQLGNFLESVIIAFGATFFLILNKLESMWG